MDILAAATNDSILIWMPEVVEPRFAGCKYVTLIISNITRYIILRYYYAQPGGIKR